MEISKMKHGKIYLCSCVFYAIFSLFFTGCASNQSGQQDAANKAVVPLDKPYTRLLVSEIEASPELKSTYDQQLKTYQSTLIASLKNTNKFNDVQENYVPDSVVNGALIVKPLLKDMRIAGGAARFFAGAMAGSSYMYIELSLIDSGNQAVLRKEELSSANNPFAAAWTSGATDQSLPSDMAEITAKYVEQAVPGK